MYIQSHDRDILICSYLVTTNVEPIELEENYEVSHVSFNMLEYRFVGVEEETTV